MAVKFEVTFDVLPSGTVRGRMTEDGYEYRALSSVKMPKGSKKEDITLSIKNEIISSIKELRDERKNDSPSKEMRCGDWCEYWLITCKKPLSSQQYEEAVKKSNTKGGRVTMSSYCRLWDTFNLIKRTKHGKQVLRKRLRNVTCGDIEDIISELEEAGYSSSSTKKVKDFFNPAFAKAKKEKYLSENPCADIKVQTAEASNADKTEVYLPKQSIIEVINEALRKNDAGEFEYPYGAGVVLQLMTGMRCGELLSLTWDAVEEDVFYVKHSVSCVNDLDDKGRPIRGKQHVFVSSTKNVSSMRPIPYKKGDIIDKCLAILRDKYDNQKEHMTKDRNLVLGTSTGHYLTLGNYNKYLKRILDVALAGEYEGISSHKLRHSYISYLVNDAKADVPSVAKIVGQSDTITTYKYANHTMSEKVVKAAGLATGLVQGLVDGLDSDK